MKDRKQTFVPIICFVCLLILPAVFPGCSGSSGDFSPITINAVGESNSGDVFRAAFAPADYDGVLEYLDDLEDSGSGFTGADLPAERKIIRDAHITMEAEDVEESYAGILARLADLGGYEANRTMSGSTYDGRRSYPTVSATFKVPADRLGEFLDGLQDSGKIINSDISSSDITEQYHDSAIRLSTLEKTLENYYRFLEGASDIDEQLRITRYINDVTHEIEQIKGSLRRWDSLVEYSTVSLYLYRPYEAPEPVREIKWNSLSREDMGWFISSGFLGICNAVFSMFQWVVIAIAAVSPVLVPTAVLAVLLVRRHKNKKKKKETERESQN